MLVVVTFIISHFLVFLGLYGVLTRVDNLIITLVCLEMALLGVALLFCTSSLILDDILGQIVFFLLLTLAGVESALGLAFIISYYRLRTSIKFNSLVALKG